jgi:cytochrome c
MLLAACGGGGEEGAPATRSGAGAPELTPFQLEHGIGPITQEVVLGAVDEELVAQGEQTYQWNCEACHRLEERFVGPPLGDVLDRRSAAFVMNMILNPEQMAREHPEGRKLLQEYPLVMPFQNISQDEARAIVEYLRTVGR